jgi:hypothetical protein
MTSTRVSRCVAVLFIVLSLCGCPSDEQSSSDAGDLDSSVDASSTSNDRDAGGDSHAAADAGAHAADDSGAHVANAGERNDDDDQDRDAGSDSGIDASTEDPGGVPSGGLPRATFPSFSTADNASFVAGVAGVHDVVIFRAPEDKSAWIGKAKLTVAKKGDEGFTLELKTAGGEVVSAIDSTTAVSFQLQPFIGMLFGLNDNAVDGYLSTTFTMEGEITGTAGGLSEVAFRNDIVAWGAKVPSLFPLLAGKYSGKAQALTCEQPDVTFELSRDGTAEIAGTYNLSCGEGSSKLTWDGNDDYVVPNAAGGFYAGIDTLKGGGSLEGGGIGFYFDAWSADGTVTQARMTGAGAAGNIESNHLAPVE